jgi:hypothetical protein
MHPHDNCADPMIMSTAECITVYDWDKPVDLLAWLDWALSCFASADMQADLILRGVNPNGSNAVSLGEIRKTAKGNARYSKDIQLFSMRPGYKQLAFGWRMCATMNVTKGRTAILACEAGLLDSFKVAGQMASIFGPAYGIGFQRPFLKGPDLYSYGMAAGLGYSGTDRTEMNRIGSWMRERMTQNRHLNGMLRDVYPLNLLTRVHLEQKVEGHSLSAWIKGAQERGQMVEVGAEQWIWRVPNPFVETVRSSLRAAGLIIAE